MGHAEMGWGGLCRGGVRCIMQGCGGLDHAGVGEIEKGKGKGDIVMDPMNSRDVLPKNVPGMGWGGSCRGGLGGWIM